MFNHPLKNSIEQEKYRKIADDTTKHHSSEDITRIIYPDIDYSNAVYNKCKEKWHDPLR